MFRYFGVGCLFHRAAKCIFATEFSGDDEVVAFVYVQCFHMGV